MSIHHPFRALGVTLALVLSLVILVSSGPAAAHTSARSSVHKHHHKHHEKRKHHHKRAPAHKIHRRRKHQVKLPKDYAAWSRVATCEEGGWYAPGGFYPDALGINYTNYTAFGGKPHAGHITLRKRAAEVRIADRLIHRYGISIPDQDGCGGGW